MGKMKWSDDRPHRRQPGQMTSKRATLGENLSTIVVAAYGFGLLRNRSWIVLVNTVAFDQDRLMNVFARPCVSRARNLFSMDAYLAFTITVALAASTVLTGKDRVMAGDGGGTSVPSSDASAPFKKITEDVVLRQPDWNPSQPLPKPVEELSKMVVDAYTPKPNQPKTGWVLQSITFFHVPKRLWPGIQHMSDESLKDKWFCRIYISSFGDYQGEWWKNQAQADVFLDGTIIQPPTAIK